MSAVVGAAMSQQRPAARADPGQLAGMAVLCIDNDPQILDGMEALLGGWGCQVLKAADLAAAVAVIEDANVILSGLLVDYHLDDGNGVDAIVKLRRRFGADLPAILITADRTPACARRSARPQCPGAQQADQAGGLARDAGAMAHSTGGGGGINRHRRTFANVKIASRAPR